MTRTPTNKTKLYTAFWQLQREAKTSNIKHKQELERKEWKHERHINSQSANVHARQACDEQATPTSNTPEQKGPTTTPETNDAKATNMMLLFAMMALRAWNNVCWGWLETEQRHSILKQQLHFETSVRVMMDQCQTNKHLHQVRCIRYAVCGTHSRTHSSCFVVLVTKTKKLSLAAIT